MTNVQLLAALSMILWIASVPPKYREWLVVPAVIFAFVAIAKIKGWAL